MHSLFTAACAGLHTCCHQAFKRRACSISIAGSGVTGVQRVLVFNCMKERDPSILLPSLHRSLAARGITVSHALFVPPESQYGFLATKRQPYPVVSSPARSGGASPTSSAADAAAGTTVSGSPIQGVGSAPPSPGRQSPTQPDLSWQLQLQQVWQRYCLAGSPGVEQNAAAGTADMLRKPLELPAIPGEPSRKGW
jgi:hypothetical protein